MMTKDLQTISIISVVGDSVERKNMAKKVTQQKRAAAKRKRREDRQKKKTPQQRPDLQPKELLTVPIWEYGRLAAMLTLEHPEELHYHDVLEYLMTLPIYLAKPGKKPRLGPPVELMAAGHATPEQFLNLMQELHWKGHIEWDQEDLVHTVSIPSEYI